MYMTFYIDNHSQGQNTEFPKVFNSVNYISLQNVNSSFNCTNLNDINNIIVYRESHKNCKCNCVFQISSSTVVYISVKCCLQICKSLDILCFGPVFVNKFSAIRQTYLGSVVQLTK